MKRNACILFANLKMRWATLWLTAVMIAATSAVYSPRVIAVDNGIKNGTTSSSTTEVETPNNPNEHLIVETKSGKVQGFLWQQEKGDIISYIDIPYGNVTKNFEAATAAEPWTELHNVRVHDKRCPQIQDNEYVGNIDCLTLSIFKPLKAENASVFFYIHGDDFKTGSGDPFIYGPDYLVSNGIILVLPNYRLGPLGFLCMKNETAPGNMALKDLSLALSWIHDNIDVFGGNPDNIVVSGDGRSGALAELLALSPMSKDHVDKVISESGSLLSHWALDRDPESTADDFFERIHEAEKSIKSRIDMTLEDLELSTIVKAGNDIKFKPCVEADDNYAFMTETPYAIITNNKIETTFLMGSAMYAGLHEALHHTEDSIKELNEDFTLLLPNDLKFSTLTSKAQIGGRVKRQYFGDQKITLENVRDLSRYYTDVGYLSPGIRSARLLAKAGATVYFYEFSFVGEIHRALKSINSPVNGPIRGDIVRYLFTQDGHVPDDGDTDERKMVALLTEMWTNFLKDGHPATETIKWNKLENENYDEEEWLLIDSDQPSMQKGLHVDRLSLWTNIYQNYFIDEPNEDLIVETNSGKVQGYLWQNKGDIISYIDIPYGTVNTTPFEAATAAEPWTELHNVRVHDKRCPQIQDNEYVGNIDCLTLSIFKPLKAENASVFFYIHGDDFKTGSGDPFIYGPDYLVSNGIILVLPNYRLGPLGFLCMKNETAPGNMALKDLSLALSWIHDNIDVFGGKPDNIVVSGDGRSGALAELLALSPMSKDHVDKVISESGSLLSHWALDRDPESTADDFFDRIHEAEKSIKSRIDMTLEDLDLSTIVKAGNDIEFKPCVEADDNYAFMTETPYAMITNNKIETTFLMGSAMYAGLHEALHHTEDSIKELNEDFTLLLPNDLKFSTLTSKAQIGGRVKTQYFGDQKITLNNVQDLSRYYTDIGYLSPGIRSARLLAKAGATVYFYEFSINRESINSPVNGPIRGDIVRYLFTQDGHVPEDGDTDERKMVALLTEMWTIFLKDGHPATETIKWNKLENENYDEEEWLLIDSDQPSMQKGLHVDRLSLWTNIYQNYFIDEPNEDLIVETNSGKVQGYLWQNKEDIISYIDIPYGTVNTTPFEAATAAEPWTELHNVRVHDKRCPQIQDNEYVGNIDCLTLSIFKPLIAESASVFFYIHGDDFKTGSGDPSIYGPDYLVSNGIILVLPNYRLGPLGFLCMKNETAPGNMALKDLSLALSWIHDNIDVFGGNPDNIVVSGDGRSGALAELLALSPMSKDHVDKVISESGSLLSHWALDRDPESTVDDFFDRIHEAEKSIKSRIDMSLEDLDLNTIVKAGNDIEFKPCVEADDNYAFMTETPYAMITNNKIETTFLMGSAMYAGLHEALHHTEDSIKELNEDFTLLLPNDLKFSTLTSKAQIGGRVKTQYFGDQKITLNNVQDLSRYYTDIGYLSPGIRSARLLAKAGATVYFYEFSINRESINSPVNGPIRGDIVRYLFTQDGHVPEDGDTDERKMVALLTEMWTIFLKDGHPATETIKWNKLENENYDEEEWLLIDSDQPSMQKGLHVDRLSLWTNIYQNYFIDEPNEDLIVETNSGKVQGYLWQNKEDIISYIDIPYGTVNTTPFEAATAAEPWTELHNVRVHDKRCPQIQGNEYVGNIDCLTLSIFKPLIAENASVFFYIHGDDFKTGSGDPSIYGPDYLVSNGIILVLPNYRLGPLGFLCMKNETAPGNMALKDLSLALSWIHDNIDVFGGNPDNIVVSGDGRSGALAELLALSPMSKDHVDKVISESGSLLSHWALDRDPESTVDDFFDRIHEAEKSIKSRIDMSLEDLDLSTIVKAGNDIEFKPCVEADDNYAFMTETPYAMITNNKIETTFLMGSAMYAGLHEALHHTEDSIKELNEDFTLLLPNDLKFSTLTSKAQIGGRVKTQYFGDQKITLNNVQDLSRYYTDIGYLSPGIRSARLLAKAGATVYFYEFSFVGEIHRALKSINSPVNGPIRGDIVRYLFTQDGHVPDDGDTDERKMVALLTEMWTNFLKDGHPATKTIEWNKLENENYDEEEWLLIDSDQPSMQKGLHVDRLSLWTNIYQNYFIDEPNEDLIVETNSGKVQGYLWQNKGDIISYIDIPYGTVNTTPFEAATAAEPWTELHNVRVHDKRCPQIQGNEYVGNIDCLTLSIFKPLIAENASVFFYIHGDDFKTGSGDPSIYGPDYLVSNGIILVLPNYRLGPLGFLCMKNETAPGNMALKDLSLALSWIHDNIDVFGGNPDNIVVSGDGRSGALAELLALSPMSKDHVDKVISESGSLLSHWALDRDPESTVDDFFDRIHEAEKSIKSRIDMSLEDLDLSTIVKAGNEIEFKPCVEAENDDAFMTETPYAMITNNKIETTFLMGSAMYAGLHEALHHTEDSIKELNEDFTLLLPNDLKFSTLTSKAEIGGRVKSQYFGDQNITLDNVQNISLYYTDVGYLSPGIRSARLLAKAGATVYFYEFSFVGEFNRELESLNSSVKGAVRGDIIGYLFTQDGRVPDEEDTDEIKMVATLTEMWTNFLKEGHPATETIEWNELKNGNHNEEEWLLIDSDQPIMQKGLHVDRLPLWTNIYENHFIENHAQGLTPAVLTVLIFQLVFWLIFCTNVSHVF